MLAKDKTIFFKCVNKDLFHFVQNLNEKHFRCSKSNILYIVLLLFLHHNENIFKSRQQ
jgi:hypothetical protein